MTLIASPIYDVVFKYLMEDNKVAKILLSALLKKEIVDLQMRPHEYMAMKQTRISLFRIDFSATIKDADGSEHLVLIELQKTWLATETLRFRQYLETHYLSKDTMKDKGTSNYGLPIISIYILGHMLGTLEEPVVYVRRRYLDYDDHVIEQQDEFIESLTHDSIIVQIPSERSYSQSPGTSTQYFRSGLPHERRASLGNRRNNIHGRRVVRYGSPAESRERSRCSPCYGG